MMEKYIERYFNMLRTQVYEWMENNEIEKINVYVDEDEEKLKIEIKGNNIQALKNLEQIIINILNKILGEGE